MSFSYYVVFILHSSVSNDMIKMLNHHDHTTDRLLLMSINSKITQSFWNYVVSFSDPVERNSKIKNIYFLTHFLENIKYYKCDYKIKIQATNKEIMLTSVKATWNFRWLSKTHIVLELDKFPFPTSS